MVEIRALTSGYHGKPLHASFSASAKSGELIILAGRNGSGKSTLLQTLAGFLPPISGEIIVNNKNLSELAIPHRASLISIVQTPSSIWTDLTVLEILELGASVNNSSPNFDRINQWASVLHLSEIVNKKIDQISDGERQKVMIARALLQNTDLILMDEPSAFLDYPSKCDLWKIIAGLKNQGKTVVVSSHDIDMLSGLNSIDTYWIFSQDEIQAWAAPLPLEKLQALVQ